MDEEKAYFVLGLSWKGKRDTEQEMRADIQSFLDKDFCTDLLIATRASLSGGCLSTAWKNTSLILENAANWADLPDFCQNIGNGMQGESAAGANQAIEGEKNAKKGTPPCQNRSECNINPVAVTSDTRKETKKGDRGLCLHTITSLAKNAEPGGEFSASRLGDGGALT